ncbi:MAG: hypothetical protein U0892_08350 [Pirellulales bacterium]
MWLLIMLGSCFLALEARLGLVTHDAFHEMALYREYVRTGEFPQNDVFAYTDTVSPSVHHEWATGAVLYWASVSSGLGLAGFSILKLFLCGLMWWFLYKTAGMRGAHPVLFALFSIAVFPFFWVGFATIRATLFTLVFIAVQLWLQELDVRGRRLWVIGWLAMMLAWLNIHAGFVVGIGLLLFHTVERWVLVRIQSRSGMEACRATWHLAAAGFGVICILPINPYGLQYISYLLHGLTMARPAITEWKPLWHTYEPVQTVIMFALSLFLVGLIVRQSRGRCYRGLPTLGLCALETLKHIRHGAIYGVIWIAYVPAWLSRTRLGHSIIKGTRQYERKCIVMAQCISAVAFGFSLWHGFGKSSIIDGPGGDEIFYPTGAVDYLERHQFRGNLLTPFRAGAYVSWELHPAVQVSFDGRYEVAYKDNVLDEHIAFFDDTENWSLLLEKYPHDAILIHRAAKVNDHIRQLRSADGRVALPTQATWRVAYEDDGFLLLMKESPELVVEDQRGLPQCDRSQKVFALRPEPRRVVPGMMISTPHVDLNRNWDARR